MIGFCSLVRAAVLISCLLFSSATYSQVKLNTLHIKNNKALQEFFRYTPDRIPLMCGHRGGAMKGYPENCIPTFEHTLSKIHAFFEVDPRLTKDSVIIVMHDATLDRTTTGTGKIADYTWEELKKLRLKDTEGNVTEYSIPRLEDLIRWSKGKTLLMLDKKNVPFPKLLKLIETEHAEDHILISSYAASEAKFYYEHNPKLMFEAFIGNEKRMMEYEAAGIPWKNIVAYLGQPRGKDLYEQIHARGAMCIIYTTTHFEKIENEKERLNIYPQTIRDGADILLSDHVFEVEETIRPLMPLKSSKQRFFSSK